MKTETKPGELEDLRRSRRLGSSQMREDLIAAFPGLIDGETDVNGSDLTEWLSAYLQESEK